MGAVVSCSRDLFDRTRIELAVQSAGLEIVHVPEPNQLLGRTTQACLVLVDLSIEGALCAGAAVGGLVIGYLPHGERDLMRRARVMGYRIVLARSAFFVRLPGLLEQYCCR
ncbi:MAG: hypothetical protein ACYDHP_11285 [Ferrimicrobium sp.]